MSQLSKEKIQWAKTKTQCMVYVSAQCQKYANDMRYLCFEQEGPDGEECPEVIKKVKAVAMAFGIQRFIHEVGEDRPFLKELVQEIALGNFVDDEPFTSEEYREIAEFLDQKDFEQLFSNHSGEIH